MKQIIKCVIDRKGKVRLVDTPAPKCGKKEIIVENECSLISLGTEAKMAQMDTATAAITTYKDDKLRNTVLNMFKTMKLTDFLRIVKEELRKGYPMGYSGAGKVVEIGSEVKGVNVGDMVSYGGAGHAELVKVPQNLFVKLPDNVSAAEGAFVTIGSICLQGIRQSKLGYGEIVVVYGLGLLGLITVQVLNAYGFKIIGIDIDDNKIKNAIGFGTDFGYNVLTKGKEYITKKIIDITGGYGADGVIICAANPKDNGIINHAFALTRRNGHIVIVGNVGMALERGEFYKKELELTISCSYGPGRYDVNYEQKGSDYPYDFVRWTENRNMQEFVYLISKGKVNVKGFITEEISINTTEDVYEKIKNDTNYNPIGVIIRYDDTNKNKSKVQYVSPQIHKINKNTLKVGLIGSGNYARTIVMPNLHKNKILNFYSLCSSKGEVLKQFAEQYRLKYITTDYKRIIEDKSVDIVHIATRHDTHQKIAVEAIKNRKCVICEKPMAMNYQELDELMKVIQEYSGNYHVCYNRRYAPFSIMVRNIIGNEKSVIKISVNTKRLSKDSWIIDPEVGGGRIIGESCHFFDLLNYFIQSKPISLYATAINSNHENIISSNNFMITVNYLNGSIGQISYSDYGNSRYPKEKIEINCNKNVLEIIDYKQIKIYGKSKYQKKLNLPNKGHTEFYNKIANYLIGHDSENIPSLEGYYFASLLPFKTIDSIKSNCLIELI